MRLFFGLSLPPEIRAATLACARAAEQTIPGRYTLGENHHITLAFLGEVPPERMKDACGVLARCAAEFPAPRLTLDGFSYFGKPGNAILILRVKSEPALDKLHQRLADALRRADLPVDPGPFSPHITLARHAQIRGDWPACPQDAFRAESAHVFLSARDHENILRYTPLQTFPFQG